MTQIQKKLKKKSKLSLTKILLQISPGKSVLRNPSAKMECLHDLHDPMTDPEALSRAVSLVEAACYIMQVKLFKKLNFHLCLIPLSQVSASAASPSKDQTWKDDSPIPKDSLVWDSDNDSSNSEMSFYSEADLGAWRTSLRTTILGMILLLTFI